MTWIPIVGKGFLPGNFDEYVQSIVLGWRPEFVVLHNTGLPTFAQWHNVSGEEHMANLENYYRYTLGWHGGPHVFVADDLVWGFTPLSSPGVHSPSWNAISWGVEIVGNYSAEPFSKPVHDNTVTVLAALYDRIGISPSTLRFHHEDPLTTHKGCPGINVNKQDLITAVYSRLGKQNQ